MFTSMKDVFFLYKVLNRKKYFEALCLSQRETDTYIYEKGGAYEIVHRQVTQTELEQIRKGYGVVLEA